MSERLKNFIRGFAILGMGILLYYLDIKTHHQFCITLKFFTDKCLISMKTFAIVSIIIGVLSILGAVISKNE